KVYHKNLSKKTLCWAYRLNPKVNLKTNPLGLAIPECFIPKQTGVTFLLLSYPGKGVTFSLTIDRP
ncbi:MAG: hypothetical protein WBI01_10455, partial [Syntrophomonadaceae bacterium]